MKRHLGIVSSVVLAVLGLAVGVNMAGAALITYVDATDGTSGNTALSAGGTFVPFTGAPVGGDDQWTNRAFANGLTIYETNGQTVTGKEDGPGLVTTITGLVSGSTYDVYAYFWSALNANWRLKASLDVVPPLGDVPAVSFSRNGSGTSTNAPALATGTDGTDNLGVVADTGGMSTGYFDSPVMILDGNRALYQGSLGTAVADGSGEVVVYIDDLANTSSTNRTWYDGVGYAPVPEPASFALLALGLVLATRVRRRD